MLDTTAISNLLAPYAGLLIGITLSLMAKDYVSNLAKGLIFKFDPMFNEGDSVIVDGEYAIIVKIGVTNTTFSIVKPNGDQVWRFVNNAHVSDLKLEKIVREVSTPYTNEK